MITRRYTLILASWFLITGILGLFMPTVLWLFTSNVTHGVIEIVLAALGFYWAVGIPHRSYYLMAVGAILLVVGSLRFIPGADLLVVRLLNVNPALAVFNLIVGVITLGFGIVDRRRNGHRTMSVREREMATR